MTKVSIIEPSILMLKMLDHLFFSEKRIPTMITISYMLGNVVLLSITIIGYNWTNYNKKKENHENFLA